MTISTTIKINETISRKAFISFLVAIVIYMVSNVDILINGDWSTKVFVFPSCLWYYLLKVLGYTLVTGLLILLGISHPGINHFLSELIEVLRDGKLSPEEKLHLIEVFKDEFLGGWADLTQLVVQEQKAKKEPPEKLP